MKPIGEKGLTLVELLVTISILGIIATAAIPLLSTCLEAQSEGTTRSELYQEGMRVMERLIERVKLCTFLEIPNAHKPVRSMLAVSGFNNDDDDYYFDDPLFPRIDEDPHGDMNQDLENGIAGIDEDGDGQVDESPPSDGDDDEDGTKNEDPIDGLDNDGDGNIDEDVDVDSNADNTPGVKDIDDNGDGQIDNGIDLADDDEDGVKNEDPLNEVFYWIPSGTTLREDHHISGDYNSLSDRVTFFQITYIAPDPSYGPRVQVALTLTGDDGESITFTEYVYPRNALQRTGKRVR